MNYHAFYRSLDVTPPIGGLVAPVGAHSVLVRDLSSDQAQVVQFGYSTGDAAPFAQIKLYAPDNASTEYQNGRTDRLGRFAFVPNQSGEWRLEMRDGMGHALNHPLKVTQQAVKAEPQPLNGDLFSRFSMPLRALLGVSLLINIYAAIGYMARHHGRKNTHAHQ
ncbi:hypothetical protein [Edwardsiella ictaluri]|uniref:hypothetical protein n=1 Tax=Edwardsiella ictaluri TaxID=67780 RepID=UPI00259D05BE|nr:hypothetical protein [Edwardsiella ictaluri]